jgi:hypothetical protein
MTLLTERFPMERGEFATIKAGLKTDLHILNEVLVWRQKHAEDKDPPDYPSFEVIKDKIVLYLESGKVKDGWSPSTSFDDAMEVAWELEQRGFNFEPSYNATERYGIFVRFGLPGRETQGQYAETLPLAICRAALSTMKLPASLRSDESPKPSAQCPLNAGDRAILDANFDWKDVLFYWEKTN